MMLMSSNTPTEVDCLYPDSPLTAKTAYARSNHHQLDRRRWVKLRALLGVGLVVTATVLAVYASHQQALMTPQSLSSSVANGVHSAGDARSSLRDSLFQAFGLAPSSADASTPAPPLAKPFTEELPAASSASLGRRKWNWLSPSGPSFSAMKEPDKELVTVSAIYRHMLDKRHTQVADAVSDLLHAELNYNLTLTCFDEAIMKARVQKFELTQAEFTNLIDWMDGNCYTAPLDNETESLSDATKSTIGDTAGLAAKNAAAISEDWIKDSEELERATHHAQGRVSRASHRQAIRSHDG